jgi:hypothetical protein
MSTSRPRVVPAFFTIGQVADAEHFCELVEDAEIHA